MAACTLHPDDMVITHPDAKSSAAAGGQHLFILLRSICLAFFSSPALCIGCCCFYRHACTCSGILGGTAFLLP